MLLFSMLRWKYCPPFCNAMPQTERAVFAQYLAIIQMSSSEEASFIDICSYLSEMGIAHKHKLET